MSSILSNSKEQHRKAIALIVCLFLTLLYVELILKPYMGHKKTATVENDSAAVVGKVTAVSQPEVATSSTPVANLPLQNAPGDVAVRDAGEVRIRTSNLETTVSLLGGRFTAVRLVDYPQKLGSVKEKVDLITHVPNAPYPLGVYFGGNNDASLQYRVVSGETDIDASDQKKSVVLVADTLSGGTIEKTLTFHPHNFEIDVQIQVSGLETPFFAEWTRVVEDIEGSLLDPYNVKGFVSFNDTEETRIAYSDVVESQVDFGQSRWLALADKYFMSAILISDGMSSLYKVNNEDDASQGNANSLQLPRMTGSKSGSLYAARVYSNSAVAGFTLILGPKTYSYLHELGYQLERAIDFGKFGLVSAPLISLLNALFSVLGNYGLAIVLLTILVKLALYPLNATSFKQMKKMQDLKPEMDRIKEEVKDKQQQQLQMMKLYKDNDANPLGGCLPMVLQMPIFIGLYSALQLAVELRHAPFGLWISDLSAAEQLIIAGFGVPVMIILFAGSMMIQQWTTPTAVDPAQKKAMLIMPVVMGFICAGFPSGLTLYMLTNNLISIGQQKALHRDEQGKIPPFLITVIVCVVVFLIACSVASLPLWK